MTMIKIKHIPLSSVKKEFSDYTKILVGSWELEKRFKLDMKDKEEIQIDTYIEKENPDVFVAMSKKFYFDYVVIYQNDLPYVLTVIAPIKRKNYYWTFRNYDSMSSEQMIELVTFLKLVNQDETAGIIKHKNKFYTKYGNVNKFIGTDIK